MTVSKVLTVLVGLSLVVGCSSSSKRDDVDVADASDQEEEGVNPDLASDELSPEGSRGGQVDVTDLRYVSSKNGGTIVIRTNGPAAYRVREVPEQKQVVIEVANAVLPDRLKRPYVTNEFNQMISAVNAYQDNGATTARFVIQLREEDRVRVEQRGSEIFVAAESGINENTIVMSPADIEDDSIPENRRLRSYGGTSGRLRDGLPLDGISLDELNYASMRFYGRPISIEVRDTSVRDVIAFISEQSGANLVVADSVGGNISLKLKQVPWDQALLLVMKARQLGYVRQGNVLRIAPLTDLQSETENARRVIEAQRAAQPLRVRIIPVSYGKVDDLSRQVKEFLSARGKIVADSRTSSLIITDIVENIERASNLVKALDIPPLQVQIEAKVIEAREGLQRELGLNWGASGQRTQLGGDLGISPTFGVNRGTSYGGAGLSGTLSVGVLDVLGQLDAQLGLLEEENEVKVISAPRVVTMNNEAAKIGQITEIPVPVTLNQNGVVQTTVNFKPVALSLEVTPQITSDSDVMMAVNIRREFAGVVPPGAQVPPVFTREATTRVMVANGQTAVIGGIYQSDVAKSEGGIPLLRKIPILGWLFKTRRVLDERNELLLFITPRILNSTEGVVKSGDI